MDRSKRIEKLKKRKRRRRIVLMVLPFIILVGVAYGLIVKPIIDNSFDVISKIKTEETSGTFCSVNNQISIGVNDGYKIVSGGSIESFAFEKDYGQMTVLNIEDKMLLVGKEKGIMLLMGENNQLLKSLNIGFPILSIRKDNKNYIAVHYRTNDKDYIKIISKDLNEEKTMTFDIGERLLDFNFDGKHDLIMVSLINHNKEVTNTINGYHFSGKKIFSRQYNDEVISNMYIDDNGNTLCISNKNIFLLNIYDDELWKREFDFDLFEYNAYSNALILCQYQQGYTNMLMIDYNNEILFETQLKYKVKYIDSELDKIVVAGEKYITEIRNNKMKTTKILKEVVGLKILNDQKLLINTSKKILIVQAFL